MSSKGTLHEAREAAIKEIEDRKKDLHERLRRLEAENTYPHAYFVEGERRPVTTKVSFPSEKELVRSIVIDDPVSHPKHYNSHPSGIECITITRHHSFNIGNAIKYLWRAGLKDGVSRKQDLEKAVWYIQDELGLHENG